MEIYTKEKYYMAMELRSHQALDIRSLGKLRRVGGKRGENGKREKEGRGSWERVLKNQEVTVL